MLDTLPQAGAQDPNSISPPSIFDEDEAKSDVELEVGACYLNNNVAFRIASMWGVAANSCVARRGCGYAKMKWNQAASASFPSRPIPPLYPLRAL
jgi:hypothetical protein